jgi:hypothetical protein
MTNRADLIDSIRALPDQLEKKVEGLNAGQLTTPYNTGEWTVAQNVHHLADSHMNSFVRFKLILTEDRPTLKPYDQETWARQPDANHADISQSLTLLRGLHQRWCALLDNLSEADWSRAGRHPEVGQITIDDLLVSYADHGEAHLRQIQAVLDAREH